MEEDTADAIIRVPMRPIDGSSNVKATGYDPRTGAVVIRYHSGSDYLFPQRTADEHQDLRTAKSVGGHASKHFLNGHKL